MAVKQFIGRFCEKFLVFYTEYKDNAINNKKYLEKFMILIVDSLTQQCSSVTSSLRSLMVRFYTYLKDVDTNTKHQEVMCKSYCQKILSETTNAFQLLSLYISAFSTMEADPGVMSPVSNSVIAFINGLVDFFQEVNSQEKCMEKILKPTFVVESTHPYTFEVRASHNIACKGAESFKLKYSKQSKFPPMEFLKSIKFVNPATGFDLLKISSDTANHDEVTVECKDEIEVQYEYSDLKKLKLEYLVGHPAPECWGFKIEVKPSFGSELLTLNAFLDQILRSSIWMIGRFSYTLMRVKKAVPTAGEKESDEDKNYKLLMQSKILSGGV